MPRRASVFAIFGGAILHLHQAWSAWLDIIFHRPDYGVRLPRDICTVAAVTSLSNGKGVYRNLAVTLVWVCSGLDNCGRAHVVDCRLIARWALVVGRDSGRTEAPADSRFAGVCDDRRRRDGGRRRILAHCAARPTFSGTFELSSAVRQATRNADSALSTASGCSSCGRCPARAIISTRAPGIFFANSRA